MAASHTAGPWRVSKNKARRVTTEHGVVICNAVLRNQGGPKHKAFLKDEHEAEANADLIAAAPCLLAMLQFCVERDPGLKAHANVMAAIARATGADA